MSIALCGILTNCQIPEIPGEDFPLEKTEPVVAAPPKMITRKEILRTAREYAAYQWTPTEANVHHGEDSQGVRGRLRNPTRYMMCTKSQSSHAGTPVNSITPKSATARWRPIVARSPLLK